MKLIPIPDHKATVGDRLTYLRKLRGFRKRTDAMEALGLSKQYNQHENGNSGISLEAALEYAEKYNAPLDFILTGKYRRAIGVPLRGTVTAGPSGAEVEPDEALNEYEDAPPGLGSGAVAFRVSGRSMEPVYSAGDLLFVDTQIDDPSTLIGCDAVCQVVDGPRLVKRIAGVSDDGLLRLESHNPSFETVERRVSAAAPIVWVKRG